MLTVAELAQFMSRRPWEQQLEDDYSIVRIHF
jgi:hypothetical protein